MIIPDGTKNTCLHRLNLYHGYICNCQLANIMLHLMQAYSPKPTQPNQPTTCSRVLLEKLTVPQLVKKFPHFMEPKVSLLNSQQPATCPILSHINPVYAPNPTS